MKRRNFITLLGGAAISWPLAARAQQPALPVIGFLSGVSSDGYAFLAAAFKKGLGQTGYVEGQNVAIEYRWANGHYERIPELAAELVGRKVAVIFASGGDASARAAKVATSSIPVVFLLGGDPVTAGLVQSLGRPAGNITGVTLTAEDLEAKRLELLHEMVPKSSMVGVLINPANPRAEIQGNNIHAAAEKLGLRIRVVHAGNPREFDAAIASAVQQAAGALLVASDPLFNGERERLVALVAQHAIPAMYFTSDHAKAGGLLGYGSNTAEMYRQAGIYAGRILKGSKPSELPVLQPTRYELVVNLVTAKTLGLEVSTSILLRADEVIE